MGKQKFKRPCSWCDEEDSDIQISIDDDKHVLTLSLGATCLYQVITHAIGNPKRVSLSAEAKPGVVN